MYGTLPKNRWCGVLGLAIALAVFAALDVMAQQNPPNPQTGTYSAPGTYPPPPYYGYGIYGGGGDYSYYGAGTTAAGSYLSGLGQAIRASGQYNLMTSEAAINMTEADKRDIENQLLWTNTYFEMRKLNQAYQKSQRDPAPPPGTWARLAHDSAPDRLSYDSVDRVTGRIAWPNVLQGPDFKTDREKLDRLFADRATMHGAIGVEKHASIKRTVEDMLAELKEHIREIDPRYYLEARTFLTGLAREADFASRPVAPPAPGPS